MTRSGVYSYFIDPKDFESRFTAWTQAFAKSTGREVIAIDGKTVRGSFDRSLDQGPLHSVSAWASEPRLVFGQRQVDDKSNEITAIPELLDTLDVKRSIVILDAMGCQRAIVSKTLERGADALVTLKANQGKIFRAVEQHCADACFARAANRPACDAFDGKHGRLVRRRVFSGPQAALLETSAGLARLEDGLGRGEHSQHQRLAQGRNRGPLLAVQCERLDGGSGQGHSSQPDYREQPALALDVTFRENDCRVRDRTAVRNLALLRKLAINLVRRHHSSKTAYEEDAKAQPGPTTPCARS